MDSIRFKDGTSCVFYDNGMNLGCILRKSFTTFRCLKASILGKIFTKNSSFRFTLTRFCQMVRKPVSKPEVARILDLIDGAKMLSNEIDTSIGNKKVVSIQCDNAKDAARICLIAGKRLKGSDIDVVRSFVGDVKIGEKTIRK